MLERARKRLTYSNVVATIALFGVLAGGVAVGAGLKKNSVGKKQLKKNAVVTKKIADGAVTTPKLGDNAVTGDKVDLSSLGTVPSALQATDATNAANATNAVSAQTATTAGTAANTEALGGNPLSAVRSATSGIEEEADVALVGSQTTVASQTIAVPDGGGTVNAFASLDLLNGAGAVDTEVDCILESGRGGTFTSMAPSAFSDIPGIAGAGYDVQVPLVGFDNAVPAGVQTIRARCRETGGGNAFFDQGSLVLEMFPTG